MRHSILALALAVTPPGHSLENALYSVNLGEIMSIATKALKEVYPDISSDKVTLANDVYVHCTSTRHQEHLYALDESFKPCEALFEFNLASTSVEHLYLNREGNCVRVLSPGLMLVYVYEDGSSQVEMYRGRDSEWQVVECADEVITQLANEPRKVPGKDSAFSVDPRAILELAFAAAVEEFPDTPPEVLDFDGMISLFCDVSVPPGGEPGQDVQIKPCTANVTFYDRSVPVRKPLFQEDGRCWIGPAADGIKVWVYANESTRTNRFGDSPRREVECNEKFYDALEQASG